MLNLQRGITSPDHSGVEAKQEAADADYKHKDRQRRGVAAFAGRRCPVAFLAAAFHQWGKIVSWHLELLDRHCCSAPGA